MKLEIQNILLLFMTEMNKWEIETKNNYDKYSIEKYGETAGENLKKIYEKFLTEKERKLGRLPIPNAGYPPEYDPSFEKIVSTKFDTEKKCQVETLWTHPKLDTFQIKKMYILKLVNEKWLIDTKKEYSVLNKKWINKVF